MVILRNYFYLFYNLLIIFINTNCSGTRLYNNHVGDCLSPSAIFFLVIYMLAGSTANKKLLISFLKPRVGCLTINTMPKTISKTPVIKTADFLNGKYSGTIFLKLDS